MCGIQQQEHRRLENAMPLVINYVKGVLAIAHNGNLTNAVETAS